MFFLNIMFYYAFEHVQNAVFVFLRNVRYHNWKQYLDGILLGDVEFGSIQKARNISIFGLIK